MIEHIIDLIEENKNNLKPAIICEKKTITYKELYLEVEQVSRMIPRKERVLIYLPNSLEYVVAFFSICKAEGTIIPQSVMAKKEDVKYTVKFCDVNYVITNTEYYDEVKDIFFGYNIKIINMDVLCLEENCDNEYKEKSNDVFLLMQTSGTTNNPKFVMHSQKNILNNIIANVESLKLQENDISLVLLSMVSGYVMIAQILSHFFKHATIVIAKGIHTPSVIANYIEKYKITNMFCAAPILIMFANYKKCIKQDISTLERIYFGTGFMQNDKLKVMLKRLNSVKFFHTYGLTEAGPRVTTLEPQYIYEKMGSIGKPLSNVELKIVDERGNEVNKGEKGELIVRSNSVMEGYYKNEFATREVLRDGWLYTGDIGYFDNDGFIFLTGRIKNLILVGGVNVSPEEVEAVMMKNRYVQDVLVLSEKNDMYDEVPIAKVVFSEVPTTTILNEVMNFCKENLEIHKRPIKIYPVDFLEKTYSGKNKR